MAVRVGNSVDSDQAEFGGLTGDIASVLQLSFSISKKTTRVIRGFEMTRVQFLKNVYRAGAMSPADPSNSA